MAEATNTTNPSVLRELANRCEREEPSRELDEAIARWFAHNDYAWWRDRVGPSNFSQSMDAAVTLIPDGWMIEHFGDDAAGAIGYMNVYGATVDLTNEVDTVQGTAKTRAAALCAAALCARSALNDGDA